jgi:SulP family sulfate permease
LLFGSYAEKVPLAVIGGMLVVIGIELIMARVPSARLVLSTREWGPITAMALTFFSALFIPLQYTIFLGALLSLLLYVGASSRKFRLQQAVRSEDGGWEMHDTPKELKSNLATVLVVQGLDFFAEVPALEDQMPSTRGTSNAVVILILRDMRTITSTAIKWLEKYAQDLKTQGSLLILADVNPGVLEVLKKSGALDVIGEQNVFPATARVLAAENMAWETAQEWLQQRPAADQGAGT